VVGLGAAGSATAYHLAQRGASVLGIDRFSPPHAMGSTHGDTRITRQAIGEGDAYVPLVLRSHTLWRALEEETGQDLFTVTGALVVGDMNHTGRLHGKAAFVARTIEAARRFDIEHDVLSVSELRNRYPQLLGLRDESGYFEPGAGFLRPELCVRAQLQCAEMRGASLHRDERVLDWSAGPHGVTVTTDSSSYSADGLVITAGAWSPELIHSVELRDMLTVYRQVMPWFDVAAVHERYTPDVFPVFMWVLAEGGVMYGAPAVDGPYGGLKVAVEQFCEATAAESVDRHIAGSELRALHAAHVRNRLDGVGPGVVRAATCMYTCTPDFEFLVDRHPHADSVVVVSACSGHGFKHSAAIGEAVAQWVLEGHSDVDLRPFSAAGRHHGAPLSAEGH